MSIQVGDEVTDGDGDTGTVLAIADGEACVQYPRIGLRVIGLSRLRKSYTPSAPEPPLTGEQMAYVLETLACVHDGFLRSAGGTTFEGWLRDAAKEFRK